MWRKSVFYPFAHYEDGLVNGARTSTKYYFFGGQRVAMRRSNVLTYLHGDHLGGTAAVTTSTGAYSTHQGYWAYGNQRTGGSLPTDHKFTGQKLDSRSGLMYYNARYYDPALGMFISPDTIVPNPGQVSSYNRFAYALGNPMKFNDPTGHENEQGDGGGAILTALFQLQGCGGSAMCEQTNVGQWLLDHPTYDPLKDPHFGEHQGYTNVLRMLTEIHRENGNQELADQYFFMLNGGIIQQAPMDTGMSLLEGMATGIVAWKVGDAINRFTRNGYPSWTTAQTRYWKNRAASAEPGEFSEANIARMKQGDAPLHNGLSAEGYEVSKELHHVNGRNIPDPHNANNLREMWPWEHAAIDPYRHYNGPTP